MTMPKLLPLLLLVMLAGCAEPCVDYSNLAFSRCEHSEGMPICEKATDAYIKCLERHEKEETPNAK
jgi:hypothetical protein